MSTRATSLFYRDISQNSDKEYHVQIVPKGCLFVVNFQYGRRGGTLQSGSKTKTPVPLNEAVRIYDSVVHEKISNGYRGTEAQIVPSGPIMPSTTDRTPFPIEDLEEISQERADLAIRDERFWLQRKMDGERRQIERNEKGELRSYNKKGGQAAVPRELVLAFEKAPWRTFFMDGELIGNVFHAFDLLKTNGVVIAPKPYRERFAELLSMAESNFFKTCPTWISTKKKQGGAAELYDSRAEGYVLKLIEAPYRAGRNGQHLKFKFLKTVTCKVIRTGDKGHNSAAVALSRDGKWIEVGRVSLNGKDNRIKVGSFVEIRFLNFTGKSLYQPRILKLRTDVDESDCTFAQLKHAYKEGVIAA